jgi:tetratricopeptide (TPR) repeat protein
VVLSSAGVVYWKQLQPLVVCPPANGNYVVLVSKFEALGVAERNVSRFIADDLNQKLTIQPSPTNFVVCEYPRVISTNEEALNIAQLNHADIIVWGNYTPNFVEAQVQVGETSDLLISQEILARTANVRVRMSDERQDSLSRQVVSLLNVIIVSKGNTYEYQQAGVKIFSLDQTNSTIVSEGVPAIELDAGNPLPYIFRATALQRLGRFAESLDDLETATRLGPAGWTTPFYLKANAGLFTKNYDEAIQYFNQIIKAESENWYYYNQRGYVWLVKGDLGKAQADIDKSIELQPTENWPYMWATSIALRQGRLADTKKYIEDGLTHFPDPDAGEKIAGLIAAENINAFTPALSAFWSMNLGQFNKAIQKSETALAINPRFTDVYLVEGISYCNLGKLSEADAVLSKAIENEPTFIVAYLLRAGVRAGLGNVADAMSDFTVVQNSPLAVPMQSYILAAQAGKINCTNLLTYTP